MTASVRRPAVAAATLVAATGALLGALLAATPAGPASATSYRYWSVWLGGPSWQYGAFNPGYQKVSAGDVVGWRFAVQGDAGGAIPPREASAYATLCPNQPGTVAVVVDFGTVSDEPPGESPPSSTPQVRCQPESARVSVDQVTEDAGFTLRICSNGLVGGISGYPKSECAPAVSEAAPAPPPAATGPPPAPHAVLAAPVPGPSGAPGTTGPPGTAAPTRPATPATASPSGTGAASSASATASPGAPATAHAGAARRAARPAPTAQAGALSRSWPAGLALLLAAGLGAAAYLRGRRST